MNDDEERELRGWKSGNKFVVLGEVCRDLSGDAELLVQLPTIANPVSLSLLLSKFSLFVAFNDRSFAFIFF